MFAVVRITGRADLTRDIKDTFKMLKLDEPNNCIIVPMVPDYKGMLEKVNNYVAYGKIEKQTLMKLLENRLKSTSGNKVDENNLKDATGFGSFEELAAAILDGKARIKDFKKLQKTFRLSPPSKGFKSTKFHYPEGDLGYRGKDINSLLERMI